MAELTHGKIGSVTVEVKPTVTLESAVACVMMLNMFLADNEGYRLEIGDEGRWTLTDEPFTPATGGIYSGVLSSIQNPGSPSNLTDEERERIAEELYEKMDKTKMNERMA